MKTLFLLLTIFPLTAMLLSVHTFTVKDDYYDEDRFYVYKDNGFIISFFINLIIFAILLIIGLSIKLALFNLLIFSIVLTLMAFIKSLFIKSLLLIISQLIFYVFLV